MPRFSARFLVLAVAFAVCLIISNIFAMRVWQLGVWNLQLSGADLIFPISYIINDCITEVYGAKKARFVIWLTFIVSAFVAVLGGLVCLLPMPFDDGSQEMSRAFNSLFCLVPRTTIGSLLAFLAGTSFDTYVLSKLKELAGGRHFSLRAVVSTVCGSVIDSIIFLPIAYMGIIETKVMLSMMLTLCVVKIIYELAVLPVLAIFVRWLKKRENC